MDPTDLALSAAASPAPAELSLAAFAIDGRVELRARGADAEPEPLVRSPHRFVYAYGACKVHVFALGAVVVAGAAAVDDALRAFVERCTGRSMLVETVDRYLLMADAQVRRPEVQWDRIVVPRLDDEVVDAVALLGVHLELAERHEALMHRMAALERSLQMIVSVWESRRARFLEWAIVWLIVVEIAMALVRG